MLKIFIESNRWKHFLGGIAVGLVLTILGAIGIASGMEFKDKQSGGKWDWWDWSFTVLGGIIGNIIQLMIIKFVLSIVG